MSESSVRSEIVVAVKDDTRSLEDIRRRAKAADADLVRLRRSAEAAAPGLTRVGASGRAAGAGLLSAATAAGSARGRIAEVATGADRGRDSLGRFTSAAGSAASALDRLSASGARAGASLGSTAAGASTAIGRLDRLAEAANTAAHRAQYARQKYEELGSVASSVQGAGVGVAAAGAAVTAGNGLAIREAIQYEQALAGVAKTTDLVGSQMDALGETFTAMSERPGRPAVETLLAITEQGAQLGITNGNLEEFATTIAGLDVSSNLGVEGASAGLARFTNIMGTAQGDMDRTASSIVALGNAGASTERDILEMALRLAGAGRQIGLSEGQVLGFANALSSLGIEAEAGGTAFSKVFSQLAVAASTGGDELKAFAGVAGMSQQAFANLFKQDSAEAVLRFVGGLSQMQKDGKNLFGVLSALGVEEVRMRDALLRSSGAAEMMRESVAGGSAAWKENTALTKEAERFYNTTGGELQAVANKAKNLAREYGTALIPAFRGVMDVAGGLLVPLRGLVGLFAAMPAPLRAVVLVLGGLTMALGVSMVAVGTFTRSIIALRVASIALGGSAGLGALLPLLIAGGPLVLGLIGVAGYFLTVGNNARQAALDAQQAAQNFKSALSTMDNATVDAVAGINVQAQEQASRLLDSARTERESARSRLVGWATTNNVDPGEMTGRRDPNSLLRDPAGTALRREFLAADARLAQMEAQVRRLEAEGHRITQEKVGRLAIQQQTDFTITPIVPTGGGGEKATGPTREQQLADAARGGVISSAEITEMIQREQSLTAALRDGNLALKQRNELAARRATLRDGLPFVGATARASNEPAGLQPSPARPFTVDPARGAALLDRAAERMARALGPAARPPGHDLPDLPGGVRPPRLDLLSVTGPEARRAAAEYRLQVKSLDQFRDKMDAATGAADAVGVALDNLGVGGGSALRALGGVFDTLRQERPERKSGVAGMLDTVSYFGGIAGSVISLVGSLFSKSETSELLQRNAEAIERAAGALEDAARGGRGLSDAAAASLRISQLLPNGVVPASLRTRYADGDLTGPGADGIERLLASSGMSFGQLLGIADQQGIELLDSQGRLVAGAFRQLAEMLGLTLDRLGRWGTGLEDQRRRAELGDRLFNFGREDTPETRIQRELGVLQGQSGDLAQRFGLANVDTSTAAGRASLLESLKSIFTAADQGLFTDDPGLLGSLTGIDQLMSIIGNLTGGLEEMARGVGAVNQNLNVPLGFKRLAQLAYGADTVDAFGIAASSPSFTAAAQEDPAAAYRQAQAEYARQQTQAGGSVTFAPVFHGSPIHLAAGASQDDTALARVVAATIEAERRAWAERLRKVADRSQDEAVRNLVRELASA